MQRTSLGKVALIVVWLAILAVGVIGLGQRMSSGRELTNFGSYVPWGLWVSAYIYFIGLSAGAFLLSSLVYVFRIEALRQVGRLALWTAATTLLMALIIIWMDLGHPFRAWEVMIRPNFNSMMAWMVWLYSGYFILILAELWFEMRCDLAALAEKGTALSPLYRLLSLGWRCPKDATELEACHAHSTKVLWVLGSIGVPLAIAFHGGVGALFATLSARPYWHSSLFPILFLTGALVSGGALLLAIVAMSSRKDDAGAQRLIGLLSKIVLGLLLLDLMLEWAETSIPLWYGVGHDVGVFQAILFGKYWYVFWIFHLGLGTIIPLVLLLTKPRARWACITAGLLIATTFLAVRLNLVIPGQITPQLEGLREAYVDPRLRFDYAPSLFEWSVVAFVIALGWALFHVGRRILPLNKACNT